MPIIRTAHTSNFTLISNAISNDATVSGTATAALIYLISKPPHWKFNAYDLKRRLNVGLNKVYKVMRELIRAGYATYQRIQSGTIWTIYDTPQNVGTATPPAVTDRVNFERVKNERVLESIEPIEIIRQLPEPMPEAAQKTVVVVSDATKEGLIYPVQLDDGQKKDAKRIIGKLKQPELSQAVLFELAYILTSHKLKTTIPRCLHGLVNIANEQGYFTHTQAATATNQGGKPLIPLWRGFKASTPSEPEKAKGFIQQAKQALRGMAIHE